jgi:hypothetical protein
MKDWNIVGPNYSHLSRSGSIEPVCGTSKTHCSISAHKRHGLHISSAIDILSVSHSLNFDCLRFAEDFLNYAIVSEPNAMGVIGARQLLRTLWKWLIGQLFDCRDDPGNLMGREAP